MLSYKGSDEKLILCYKRAGYDKWFQLSLIGPNNQHNISSTNMIYIIKFIDPEPRCNIIFL